MEIILEHFVASKPLRVRDQREDIYMKNAIQVLTDFSPTMFSNAEPPLVSIYLPTHRHVFDNQQDPLQFKNLVAEVETALAQNYSRKQYTPILKNLEEVAIDPDRVIWRYAKDGLAVLADKDGAYIYHLDYPVENSVFVADHYHIKPLIRNFQYGSHYYLLALSADQFSLYSGDFNSIEKVALPDTIKTKFSDIYDDLDNNASIRSAAYGGPDPNYYGQGSKSDAIDKETEKFFRTIDKELYEYLHSDYPYPIILVSLTQHQSLYRAISSLPTLLDKGIEKPFESMTDNEVLADATALIQDIQQSSAKKILDSYGLAHTQNKASDDLVTIGHALVERKVSTLFVEAARRVPGEFDSTTGSIDFGTNGTSNIDDLADDFAQATYLQGGTVYVFDSELMPSTTGVAALFRY